MASFIYCLYSLGQEAHTKQYLCKAVKEKKKFRHEIAIGTKWVRGMLEKIK